MEELLELLKSISPEIDFEHEKKLVDNHILTSMNIIKVITAISKKYDIRISPIYLTPQNFNSIESIYKLIEKLEEE